MRLLYGLRSGRESLRDVVAALEADVEAMYELIDRYDGERGSSSAAPRGEQDQATATTATPAITAASTTTTTTASAATTAIVSNLAQFNSNYGIIYYGFSYILWSGKPPKGC